MTIDLSYLVLDNDFASFAMPDGVNTLLLYALDEDMNEAQDADFPDIPEREDSGEDEGEEDEQDGDEEHSNYIVEESADLPYNLTVDARRLYFVIENRSWWLWAHGKWTIVSNLVLSEQQIKTVFKEVIGEGYIE